MDIGKPSQISPEGLGLKILIRDFFNRKTEEVAKSLLGKVLVRRINYKFIIGRIVEVEAYVGEHDPAAHAFTGRTERTKVLYGEPGHAYIFRIRGHHCLNAVAEKTGIPGCVLIRAVEPILGIEKMREFRRGETKRFIAEPKKTPSVLRQAQDGEHGRTISSWDELDSNMSCFDGTQHDTELVEVSSSFKGYSIRKSGEDVIDLTNGPGKLCQAFDINLSLYGVDLTSQNSLLFVAEMNEKSEFEIEVSKRVGVTKATDWELRFTIKNNKFVSRW